MATAQTRLAGSAYTLSEHLGQRDEAGERQLQRRVVACVCGVEVEVHAGQQRMGARVRDDVLGKAHYTNVLARPLE